MFFKISLEHNLSDNVRSMFVDVQKNLYRVELIHYTVWRYHHGTQNAIVISK